MTAASDPHIPGVISYLGNCESEAIVVHAVNHHLVEAPTLDLGREEAGTCRAVNCHGNGTDNGCPVHKDEIDIIIDVIKAVRFQFKSDDPAWLVQGHCHVFYRRL
ncbi:CxxxxCH/CxxCH domain-containing protein [Chloroflexota bacterium]